jgi:hypothetical protein
MKDPLFLLDHLPVRLQRSLSGGGSFWSRSCGGAGQRQYMEGDHLQRMGHGGDVARGAWQQLRVHVAGDYCGVHASQFALLVHFC